MAAPPVPACPLMFGAQTEFLTRRSYCSTPGLVELTAVVVVLHAIGPPTVRVVGTGVVAVVRRFELQRPDPRAVTAVGFQGRTGVLARVTRLRVHSSCEFAFGTRCFSDARDDDLILATGAIGEATTILRVGALSGDLDYGTPWTTIELRALTGASFIIAAAISDPRFRCDTRATPRTGCVYADYTPTLAFSAALVPEIAAHVQAAQRAGHPGAPSQTPLTRTSRANIRDNRRLACPQALRREYRRQRPDGSCDEYPFASTDQGGADVSRANVVQRQNNIQGGLIGGFYTSQRVLTGDAFYVTTAP